MFNFSNNDKTMGQTSLVKWISYVLIGKTASINVKILTLLIDNLWV